MDACVGVRVVFDIQAVCVKGLSGELRVILVGVGGGGS